ncbi:MAG: Fur family transcriptional regulator [Chloroflexia bacterium]
MTHEHNHTDGHSHDYENTRDDHPDYAYALDTQGYSTLLRERGFRVTPQRQMILEAITEGGGHVAPDVIFELVQKKSSAVNRATLYRNLDFLCEQRLVAVADIGGRKTYEIVGVDPHHHLVCRQCERVKQIPHEALQGIFREIGRDQSFTIDMEHLIMFGLCDECRDAQAKTNVS